MQARPPLCIAAGVSSMIGRVRSLAMARAPGGKAGADSPSVHPDPSRLVAFSDAVFAITITLLVLEIRPPTDYNEPAAWSSRPLALLSRLRRHIPVHRTGFWANQDVMFDHIRAAERVVLLLNTLLLMAVAFLPFATSLLAGRCTADTASEPPSSSTPSHST
jgi:uncharacterized membrane protein